MTGEVASGLLFLFVSIIVCVVASALNAIFSNSKDKRPEFRIVTNGEYCLVQHKYRGKWYEATNCHEIKLGPMTRKQAEELIRDAHRRWDEDHLDMQEFKEV